MSDEPPIKALKALAHPVRNTIIEALIGAERNVSEIEAVTGIGQPALSQQLAVLRNAGLVETRKDGKLIYYNISDAAIEAVRQHVERLSPRSEPERKDRPAAAGVANYARLA